MLTMTSRTMDFVWVDDDERTLVGERIDQKTEFRESNSTRGRRYLFRLLLQIIRVGLDTWNHLLSKYSLVASVLF